MPTYSLMIVSEIEFEGGSSSGTGKPQKHMDSTHWGGAGYEVQVITIFSQRNLTQKFLCNAATQQARSAIIKASQRYSWVNQGLRWRIRSCTLIGVI
jgi:hypothetical protein